MKLIDAQDVSNKLARMKLNGLDDLEVIPRHIVSQMLPMSIYFEIVAKSVVKQGGIPFVVDELRKEFKEHEALAVLFGILYVNEMTGLDISENSEFMKLLEMKKDTAVVLVTQLNW